ncbi:MAG: hypothetical protein KUG79_18390 [Pseudomonadales bacterium]|nr:hypothetical protein [Pseudomonadales bacterium]
MSYLIIVIIILVIIAPIISILPNARQKTQLVKRKAAMAEGIRVELVQIDDVNARVTISTAGKEQRPKLSVVAYRFQRARPVSWREVEAREWSLNRVTKNSAQEMQQLTTDWTWLVEPGQNLTNDLDGYLKRWLADMPDDIVRVEDRGYILSIYWQERGEVARIIDFLTDCSAMLSLPGGKNDGID